MNQFNTLADKMTPKISAGDEISNTNSPNIKKKTSNDVLKTNVMGVAYLQLVIPLKPIAPLARTRC